MFVIKTIDLVNFKSFKGEHIFKFPTKPGLYLLTGDNQDEPKLGSNGAGKSTLLDAVYWCLFGKSLRGLKASDVITWGEDHCIVTVSLRVGRNIVVTRSQNPNSLNLLLDDGPHTIAQDELEKLIGLNPESFVYS